MLIRNLKDKMNEYIIMDTGRWTLRKTLCYDLSYNLIFRIAEVLKQNS